MPENSSITFTKHFSVSLAHRYYDDGLTAEENKELFGSVTSLDGLGSNLDFDVEALTETLALHLASQIKSEFDHKSLIDSVSSLENLCLWAVNRHRQDLASLTIHESKQISVRWEKSFGSEMLLTWRRPLSVLWKRSNDASDSAWSGARLDAEFSFKGPYQQESRVLIARSTLEQKLESLLSGFESGGWQIPDPVNRTQFEEEFLGALLKEVGEISNLLHAVRVEIGLAPHAVKKWLIRHRVGSR